MSLFDNWLLEWLRRLLRGGMQPPPPAACPISWQPSVTAPVFYGTRDYAPPSFAVSAVFWVGWPPGTFRVFYPSLDGSPSSAAMLEPCGRYPLIVFLHGHCSADDPVNYRKWIELPADLARSGNVVVVPHLRATGRGTAPWTPNHADIPLILAIMRWMRADWEFARVLMPEPATGIVAHSYGALLGARIALEQQQLAAQGQRAIRISAFAGLSGVWGELPQRPWPIEQLSIPQLFLWGTTEFDVQITAGIWNDISAPKHRAVFRDGEHWDYLPAGRSSCDDGSHTCPLVGVLSGDLIAAFFGKYLPPERWPLLPQLIPDNLIATLDLPDSFERSFYAGGHLMGFTQLDAAAAHCSVTLAWGTAHGAGEQTHP